MKLWLVIKAVVAEYMKCIPAPECPASKPEYANKNKEAEWVYDHWCEFRCSNCGNWSNSKPYKGKEKYCPECGAKMKNA